MMSTAHSAQRVRSQRQRRIRDTMSMVLTYLALLAFAVFFLMPIVWIVLTSFKRQVDTFSVPPVWIFTPVLDHYQHIFWRVPIWTQLKNSTIASVGAVFISTVVGSLAAYGISRMGKKAYDNLSFWFLSQRMLPLVVIVLPLFMIFRTLRLYDTHLGLILAYTNLSLPFVVWMMITYFDDLPIELEEAAMLDGCNRMQIFFRIALPLVAPGLVATAVFCLALTWSDFILALILTGPKTKTVPLEILGYFYPTGTEGFNWGPLTAISVVVTVPVFVFILLVQRWLVRGLTLGAVKG